MTASEEVLHIPDIDLIPRGGCLSGDQCEWLACRSLSEFMRAGNSRSHPTINPAEDPEIDPWELLDYPETTHWQIRQAKADKSLEIFAAEGDVEGGILAAHQLAPTKYAINRILGVLPHTDEVYEAARAIVSNQPDAQEKIQMNALIEAFRVQDSRIDKQIFIKALKEKISSRRAATIAKHGDIVFETA